MAAQGDRSSNGTAIALERIAGLHRRGALSDDEFAAAKARIIGTSASPVGADAGAGAFPAVEANIAAARHLANLAGNELGASGATMPDD